MDNDTKGSAKHLIKQLENIEWDQYREDEKTWILRALIKAAQDWQSNHNLEPKSES
ncbi:hypothetical protein [Pseudomonas syringae group sp. J309-1]|uniref:hypothetical protein n=1 Tax=Pseudomonas syringae group sp. J309-1 TaxID=3079588 RepID=UPI0029151A81|nr:hypothetical protein [Pseudomonas syringae group sp. J309-1]MDU8362781.1 hypothetical protein [Pseudomonas syringae group sp. J309-1]